MSSKSQYVHITGIALPKNSRGILKHVNDIERSEHDNYGFNVSYSANEASGLLGDMEGHSKIHVYGSTSTANHLQFLVSGDNSNYYRHHDILPIEHNGTFHFSHTNQGQTIFHQWREPPTYGVGVETGKHTEKKSM